MKKLTLDGIHIEKNIPEPMNHRGHIKYPFQTMQVGDSFLFPEIKAGTARANASLANKRYKPKKFRVHVMPDGMRCWRIK